MFRQVDDLFAATISIGKDNPLSKTGELPLLGMGFAKLVDFFNALCVFGTKTAYEKIQVRRVPNFTGFQAIYHAVLNSHDTEGRRELWQSSWIDFVNDSQTKPFAKKPLFAVIGKSLPRKTNHDLILEQIAAAQEEEEAVVSILHYFYIVFL